MADSHDAPHASLPSHLPGEAAISRRVHAFYGRARQDRLLGPVFEAAVQDGPAHMGTLVRFWSSVLLRSGTGRANPMAAHQPLRLDEEHCARWLGRWHATAQGLLPAAQAGHGSDIAQRIGRSLRIGLGI